MKQNIVQSFYDGYCLNSFDFFGAHLTENGAVFRVYAPNARSVRVAGDFNYWNNSANFMNRCDGYWELYVDGLKEYDRYKYVVEQCDGSLVEKSDPFAFYGEMRPSWSNKIVSLNYDWNDWDWMNNRSRCYDQPMSIYEVHLGGWKHHGAGRWFTYYEMIDELIPYVKEMGYTHIELLPLNEHALDASWGYQQYGYFACTSRYGSPYQLQMFIDACHRNGIGVIMDIVIVHFMKDSFGLAKFDGTPLYESSDPSKAESSWGTCYFDFSKNTVKSFLLSSASLWLEKYHIDGLRVDAVSNLIYFQGNKNLGSNEDAISFIKRFNYHIHEKFPSVMTIAEDSSDYPKVTGDPAEGLGFDYKWDLGWMNDTLSYYKMDPEYRKYHHNKINFSMAYFFSERFLLPLSHDEVVHSKGTIIDKMWGDYDAKFAQCRNLMVYMYTHPGKKLNFMGNELASFREFDENKEIDWLLLQYPNHDCFKRLCRDLNYVYRSKPSFWKDDYSWQGFKWIDADNANDRIYTYYRTDGDYIYVVVLNMAPISYEDFAVGVPDYGYYTEIINTERDIYGGCNMCNYHKVVATKQPQNNQNYRINIRIAPYAGIIFEAKRH